jgi:hypothetical protein
VRELEASDPGKELEDVLELLRVHPGFRVARVRPSRAVKYAAKCLGSTLKAAFSLKFRAEFDHSLTLLSFRLRAEGVSPVTLDLLWHADEIPSDCAVFVHFIDESGTILMQGDHTLPAGPTGPSRLLSTRSTIQPRKEAAPRAYSVRLGVWSPLSSTHLRLTKVRGAACDSKNGYSDAVVLGSYKV